MTRRHLLPHRLRIQRHWAVAGLILGATLVALGVILVPGWAKQPAANPLDQTKPTKSAAPLSASQAKQLGQKLSGSETDLRSAVAIANDQPIDADARKQIAALSPITFDAATFRDRHDGTATVTAHTANGRTWQTVLINIDGQWKVSTTENVQ